MLVRVLIWVWVVRSCGICFYGLCLSWALFPAFSLNKSVVPNSKRPALATMVVIDFLRPVLGKELHCCLQCVRLNRFKQTQLPQARRLQPVAPRTHGKTEVFINLNKVSWVLRLTKPFCWPLSHQNHGPLRSALLAKQEASVPHKAPGASTERFLSQKVNSKQKLWKKGCHSHQLTSAIPFSKKISKKSVTPHLPAYQPLPQNQPTN